MANSSKKTRYRKKEEKEEEGALFTTSVEAASLSNGKANCVSGACVSECGFVQRLKERRPQRTVTSTSVAGAAGRVR